MQILKREVCLIQNAVFFFRLKIKYELRDSNFQNQNIINFFNNIMALPKILSNILSYLNYLDLFQVPINLYYHNRKKRSSIIGLFFSFGLLIFLLFNFSQSDLFMKKSPYVVSQTITNPHSNPIHFDNKTLLIVSVSDGNNVNFIDSTIFTVKMLKSHLKLNDTSGQFEVVSESYQEMHLCSENDVSFDPSLMKKLAIKDAFCLENKEFILEGFWDESELTYMKAELRICDNSTSNNTCKSLTEIKSFFNINRSYFNVYFQGLSMDINNYEKPLKRKYDNYYQMIDANILKRFNFFFKKTDIVTDDGWFFSQKHSQTDFSRDTHNFDFALESGDGLLQEFYFYASYDSQNVTRRYQNLSEALASLAGLANFLMFFGYLFTNFQNNLNIMLKILNSLYISPNLDRSQAVSPNKQIQSVSPAFFIPSQIPTDRSKVAKNNIKNNLIAKIFFNKEIVNKEKSKSKFGLVKISLCEYLFYYFRKPFQFLIQSAKHEFISSAVRIYEEEMDIVKILTKLNEIEKLKLVIFNEDQRILFQALSKPMLSLDSTTYKNCDKSASMNSSFKMANLIHRYKSKNKNQKQFLKSYEKVQQSDNESINIRLLELVDQNISFIKNDRDNN